jgi:hypothetical protein
MGLWLGISWIWWKINNLVIGRLRDADGSRHISPCWQSCTCAELYAHAQN